MAPFAACSSATRRRFSSSTNACSGGEVDKVWATPNIIRQTGSAMDDKKKGRLSTQVPKWSFAQLVLVGLDGQLEVVVISRWRLQWNSVFAVVPVSNNDLGRVGRQTGGLPDWQQCTRYILLAHYTDCLRTYSPSPIA